MELRCLIAAMTEGLRKNGIASTNVMHVSTFGLYCRVTLCSLLAGTAHASQIGFPSLLLVLLGSLDGIGGSVDTTSCNDKVRTAANGRLWRLVLLAKLVSLGGEVDTGGENDKVLVVRSGNAGGDLGQSPGGNETEHEAWVLARVVHGGRGVGASGEGALGGHLGQDQQAALGAVGEVIGLGGLRQGFNDTLAGENAAVDNMGPFRDLQGAVVVLLLHGVANVDELAVFEDEEVVLRGQGIQTANGLGTKVGENIDMGLDDGDIRTETYLIVALDSCIFVG